MGRHDSIYELNPDDPRAPPQDVWERMSESQRQHVLESLPSDIPRAVPPEGDAHSRPKYRAKDTLSGHFGRLGRRIYLATELPVYYPDEPMFAPDLLAVLDLEPHERDHWTVSHEGRGLDFVLEIHVKGRQAKDFEENVERYAKLGIPEYFAFARGADVWRAGACQTPPRDSISRCCRKEGGGDRPCSISISRSRMASCAFTTAAQPCSMPRSSSPSSPR